MSDREVLQLEIDSSGMVSGGKTAVRQIDDIRAAAGTTAPALGKFDNMLAGAGLSSKALGNELASLTVRYLSAGTAIGASTALLRSSITAAMEAEESEARLALAVRLRGESFSGSATQLVESASRLQDVTRFEDDAIMRAQAILLRLDSVDSTNLERVTKVVLDFAEASGQDAPAAASALMRSLNEPGEGMRILAQLGIKLTAQEKELLQGMTATGAEAEALAFMLGKLEAKIGSTATEMGSLAGGSLAQLKHALGDILETVGAPLIGVVTDAAGVVKALRDGVSEMASVLPSADTGWGRLLATLGGAASPLGIVRGLLHDVADLIESVGGTGDQVKPPFDANAWGASYQARRRELDELRELVERGASTQEEASKRAIAAFEEEEKAAQLAAAEKKRLTAEVEALARAYAPAIAQQQEWAADLRRMTALYQQGRIDADLLAAALDQVEQKLAALGKVEVPEIKLPSPDEMLTEIETRWVDSIEEGAAAWREVDAIIDDLAIDAMVADTQGFMKETLELEKEWEEFQKQVSENFVRGVQSSLSTFFYDLLSGGEDALKNFGRSLKDLLFKTLAEYLAQWAITQAQKAADAAGGYPSASGPSTGAPPTSGLSANTWTAVAGIAAVAALAAISKYQRDRHEAVQYGTTVRGGFLTESTQNFAFWTGKLSQTAQLATDAINNLYTGIQDATGSFVKRIDEIVLQIRNDKKDVMAFVGGVLLGHFQSVNEAIIAAMKKAFAGADLSKEMDPIIQQVISGYRGTDPAELLKNVQSVQEILDGLSGLSEIELALQDLPEKADALGRSLRSMGVSMVDAQRISLQYQSQQLSALRDQITGHQRTAAEEMAERQRQAVMFNAELALLRAELEAKKAALEGRAAVVRAGGAIDQGEIELGLAHVGGLQHTLDAEAGLLGAELQMRGAYLGALGQQVGIWGDLAQQQIDAINAILASLPAAIDLKEIKINRPGGGGGAAAGGSSRQDDLGDFLASLQSIERQALPPLVAQLAELDDWLAEAAATAARLGVPLERITALYELQKQALVDQAQAEVGQYLQSPEASRLAEIYAWRDEMVDVYTSLGLDIQSVLDATAAQLRQLGQDVLGSLGLQSVATRQQFEALAAQLDFLRNNLEALGMTTEDYAAITRELGDQAFLSLADGLAQFVGTEEQKAALEQLRWEMELYNYQLQFEYLQSLGLLTAEQIAMVQALLDAAAGYDPATGSGGVYDPFGITTGGDSSNAGGWGGSGGSEADQAMQDLIRALDRLREFQESLLLNEQLTPLTTEQQYYEAQSQYQQLLADLAAAQAAGDTALEAELISQLPDVASTYLDLAAQMFGSATEGYQQIFDLVVSQLEAILGSYEPNAGADFDTIHGDLGAGNAILAVANSWHMWNNDELVNHSLILTSMLTAIEDLEPVDIPPGGGGTQAEAAMRMAGENAARLLAFPSGRTLSDGIYGGSARSTQVATLNATMLRIEQRLAKLDRLDDIERRLGDVEREVRASGQAMDRAVTSAPVGSSGLTTIAAPARRRGAAA